jgi:hypothetical protein
MLCPATLVLGCVALAGCGGATATLSDVNADAGRGAPDSGPACGRVECADAAAAADGGTGDDTTTKADGATEGDSAPGADGSPPADGSMPSDGGATCGNASCSDATAPCVTDADCHGNGMCRFKISDGCKATGQCLVKGGGPICNVIVPACTCAGTETTIACMGSPAGYASAPIAHLGACRPASDAGADAADGGFACGNSTCVAGETCVQSTTSGGACLPHDDAGACPVGSQPEGPCCGFSSVDYACRTTPAACHGTATCSCASSLCGPATICTTTTNGELDCEFLAP